MPPKELDQHRHTLLNYFLRRRLSHWDAEDLTQDALLKLLRMEHQQEAFSTGYLYAVARSLMIDKYREANRRKKATHIDLPQEGVVGDNSFNPDFQMEEERLTQQLSERLLALTDLQRTTFIENRLKGRRLQSIANQRAVSLSAVEKVASKANHSVMEFFNREQCA